MAFCLPKIEAEKVKNAIRSGEITPLKLIKMESGERRAFFEQIVGKENAFEVNALVESKLLLKNQQNGLVTAFKQMTGLKEAARRDLLSTVQRMDKLLSPDGVENFLKDATAKRLGTEVTFEEITAVTTLAKKAAETKDKIVQGSPNRSPERMEHGYYIAKLQDLVRDLKEKNTSLLDKFKEEPIVMTAGTVKSVRATADISFTFRQGYKVIATHPSIWFPAFLRQFKHIALALKGVEDPLIWIRSDILSRDRALNGAYERGGADLGVIVEEPFPTELPGRIPIAGRLFNAAKFAYEGFALETRAGLVDLYMDKAEAFGLNMKNKAEARSPAMLGNSLTGRGHLLLPAEGPLGAKNINATFFSVRFWKSNYDVLTMHSLGFGIPKSGRTIKTFGIKQDIGRAFVRKEAAINLSKIVLTTAATLWLAKQLGFSVELRPQSTKFGQVCYNDLCYDVSGGMRGLVTLAARILTGEFINSKGKKSDLYNAKFGGQDGVDVLVNHGLGKLSPTAGLLRDLLRGKDFQGKPITPSKVLISQTTPISFESWLQLKDSEEAADLLAAMIAEGLGVGVTQYK